MSARAHKAAILGRLREDPGLAPVTFEGVVESKPTRYCTVFSDSGSREQARFTGGQTLATFAYTVHSVGSTPDQAQWVAERVMGQLLDFRPTIPGFACRRVQHVASQPTQIDRDSTPPLFWVADVFELTSEAV